MLRALVGLLWVSVQVNDPNLLNEYSIQLSIAGGMKGADIAVGWVDSSGKVFLQV
jgi:hypothetical protein